VLELGCASGDNLIPLAVAMPAAHCVGLDLSARQIERGQATVDALRLTNIALVQGDVAAIDASFGTFDHIVAHGVYSWVPAAVRDKVLAICASNLAPDGVAYISYNTLPGWSTHSQLRELMLLGTRSTDGVPERIQRARAMLDFLATALPASMPQDALLRTAVETLRAEPDTYLFHDHLEEVNEPVYFHRFAGHAATHGLKYLAEAELSMMSLSGVPIETIAALKQLAPDIVAFEQLTDVFRNRAFRQSLLVHESAPIDRRLGAHSIEPFAIASPVTLAPDETTLHGQAPPLFVARSGRPFALANPLTRAALCALVERWPEDLSFGELFEVARIQSTLGHDAPAARKSLADELLQLYAAGIVQLRTWTPPVTSTVGDRPQASALARLQAASGDTVTTLLHQPMKIDGFDRALISLLDGTRDVATLAAAVSSLGFALASDPESFASRGSEADDPIVVIRDEIRRLAKAGLILRT
jgi:SAM-dependent methyltransferase